MMPHQSENSITYFLAKASASAGSAISNDSVNKKTHLRVSPKDLDTLANMGVNRVDDDKVRVMFKFHKFLAVVKKDLAESEGFEPSSPSFCSDCLLSRKVVSTGSPNSP
jgi:hypothetical protein